MVKTAACLLSFLLAAPAGADPIRNLSKKIHADLQNKSCSLGVLNFTYDRGRMSTGSYLVSERVLTYLVQDGAVVVERRLLDSLLAEQRFAQIGITNIDSLKRAGKILGVDAVVVGSLSDRPDDSATDVVARVIRVDTAQVLAAGTAVAPHEWHDTPHPFPLGKPQLTVPEAISMAEMAAPVRSENPMIRLEPNEPKRTVGEYPLLSPVPLFPAAAQRILKGGVQ